MVDRLRHRVLVIDDDPVFVRWVTAVLSNAGYSAAALGSLAAGPIPAEVQNADLLILDLALPDRDGFEVLEALRASPAGRDLPILMMTAHDPVSYRLKGLALGADDYLIKPPNKQELLLRIQALLRRSKAAAPERVVVHATDRSRVLLDPRDIVFVQAANNYCYVYVSDRRYILSEGMTLTAGRLGPQLLRIHRSYLVNPAHVLGVHRPTRSSLVLEMDTQKRDLVPVGASYRESVIEALGLS